MYSAVFSYKRQLLELEDHVEDTAVDNLGAGDVAAVGFCQQFGDMVLILAVILYIGLLQAHAVVRKVKYFSDLRIPGLEGQSGDRMPVAAEFV